MSTIHDGVPRWFVALFPCVGILFVLSYVGYLGFMWPETATDPAFFQHTGWYVLNAGIPYVDVWDVNPPIVFGLTAVLAAFSGGNMVVLQTLSGALMTVVNATSVLLVGWLAFRLTDDDVAAVAAGLVVLLVPEMYLMPPVGTRAQFYALFFGLVALRLVLQDRPVAAGALAALSAGCWQPGAGFVLLVGGMAAQHDGWRGTLSVVIGTGVVAGPLVLGFAAVGALVPMGVETILAPFVGGAPYTLPGRIYSILLVFGYGMVVLPVAFYGWSRTGHDRRPYWVIAGALLFGLQALIVDMDGSTDLVLWLAFVAFGVALAVAAVDPFPIRIPHIVTLQSRQWIVVVLVVLVLSGPVWHVTGSPLKSTLQDNEERATPDEELPITKDEASVPDMQTIYWEKRTPETCHYRLSRNELRWIAATDDRLHTIQCGQWPTEF
ncbi:DolP-mannose mannosyltransferase [Halocatena salina]|uniref:DolP-mannose mannosyltransferase n=1 Tax=Halocatena salina TaxID=2934340 RepID=A0A8U0A5V1_9EURY|nr:DolP-mannose mannosyltransferase [Halocatena salina]UPM44229.1 DolP-mannose mannosyltransferase [Halocatena salina]